MSRRGENIYKRQDGRWEARYIKGRNFNGRAIYGYVYRHSYLEAKRAQAEAKIHFREENLPPMQIPHQKTLQQYLLLWLDAVRMSVKKSTFAEYDGMIHRHITPFIGKIPLSAINSEVIQKYINQKLESGRLDGKGGLSVKTVRDIAMLLKRSLKMGGIDLDIKLPKYNLPKLHVLTHDEQVALIEAAKNTDGTCGLGVLISLFTGIRIGELCSLRWGDVSVNEGVLKINKTLQRIKNCDPNDKCKTIINIDTPKSECSIRDIPLPSSLLGHLAQLKKHTHDEDYILSGTRKYVEPRLCQYRFKKLINDVGIDPVNYHALRHTFATRCVELGIDIKTISELLGHSNVNITLNRYVHPAFEHQRECMEKLSVSF